MVPWRPPSQMFSVLPLRLESGEHLPLLVDSTSWSPVLLAMRWAVLERRYQVQSSTLAANLRVLGKLYTWAARQHIDLDHLLTRNTLTPQQIRSLVKYYRNPVPPGVGVWSKQDSDDSSLSSASFDYHLMVTRSFLVWALRTSFGSSSTQIRSYQELEAVCNQIEYLIGSKLVGARPSERQRPLSDAEVAAIRASIAPERPKQGLWSYPPSFSRATGLRNWLMFEIALGLGLRRAELLKLRLDDIPRGQGNYLKVERRPDDPKDSRRREPAVKTLPRAIETPDPIPQALHAYLTLPPPRGRVSGKSPYLFTSRTGEPVSVDMADDIIKTISQKSGIDFSWHNLRHTWAERTAKILLQMPNGVDRLKYLGGWSSDRSVERYTKKTIAEQANSKLKSYQQSNLGEEREK